MPKQSVSQPAGLHRSQLSSGQWARACNALLGVWLFASAFAWQHASIARTNSSIVGLLIFVCSTIAAGLPMMRRANTALSIWLLISAFGYLHLSHFTVWHNAIVAALVFALSLVREPEARIGETGTSRPGT